MVLKKMSFYVCAVIEDKRQFPATKVLEGWNGRLHALSFEFDINKTCNLEKKVENMGKVCF